MARAATVLALALTALAGCGSGQTRTVTRTTTAGQFSARDNQVKAAVEAAITRRVTASEAATGDGSTFDPNTATACIATTDTTMTCQVTTSGQQQTWAAIVDRDTGRYGIQPAP